MCRLLKIFSRKFESPTGEQNYRLKPLMNRFRPRKVPETRGQQRTKANSQVNASAESSAAGNGRVKRRKKTTSSDEDAEDMDDDDGEGGDDKGSVEPAQAAEIPNANREVRYTSP